MERNTRYVGFLHLTPDICLPNQHPDADETDFLLCGSAARSTSGVDVLVELRLYRSRVPSGSKSGWSDVHGVDDRETFWPTCTEYEDLRPKGGSLR